MDWFLMTIAASMAIALIAVLDKRMLEVHFPSTQSFLFMVGTIWLFHGCWMLTAVLILFGVPHLGYMALGCAAGVLMGWGMVLFLFGLRFEEVSRGFPIFGTAPLFAALLAVFFLSEKLAIVQWVSLLFIVFGAGLLAFRPAKLSQRFIGGKGFTIFLAGALFAGGSLVLNKQASTGLTVWILFASFSFGLAFSLTTSSFSPNLVGHVLTVVRSREAMRLFLFSEFVLGAVGVVLLQAAIKLGPISIVSGIFSSRSLFVFIFAALLSTRFLNLLDEPLDRQTLGLKSISIVIIVAGLVGLAVY